MRQPSLSAEASAAADLIAELRDQLAGDDDEQLLRDMVEGETGYNEAMKAAYERYLAIKGEIAASADRLKQIKARKEIAEGRLERLQAQMLRAVEAVGMPFRIEGEATISAAKSPDKMALTVTIDEVPDEYLRVKIEPDLKAIRGALDAGKAVPFAAKVDGGTHLVIRRA